jgi:WD40 repeat protein
VNRDAIYFMLEVSDSSAPYVLFDIHFNADGKELQITWQPGQVTMRITDWSSETPERIGHTSNSQVAYTDVLEARIDLNDFQDPTTIERINIMVMADVPEQGWTAVDTWQSSDIPVVLERDSLRISSNEEIYFYARYWNLPPRYVGEALLESAIANNAYITHSEDGRIYFQSFGAQPQVTLVDPLTQTAAPILDLPLYVGLGMITSGPGSSVYLNVDAEVWQIFPDGTYDLIGHMPNAFIRYHMPDGRFLAISPDTLFEWSPDGTERIIAGGFASLFDAVGTSDGTIFAYDAGPGNVIRINSDGSQKILVNGILAGEYATLGLDSDENLYGLFGVGGFTWIDKDTGGLTVLPAVFSPCAWNPNGFTIIGDRKVYISGDQVVWAELDSGENGILILNQTITFAADIGPDNALYIGAPGCGDQIPAQILRIEDDGSNTVYLDGLRDTIDDLAFTPDGGLFIATKDDGGNHIFYRSPTANDLIEIPGVPQSERLFLAASPLTGTLFVSQYRGVPILEFNQSGLLGQYAFPFNQLVHEVKLDFAPDGTLYALASSPTDAQAGYTDRWILRLELSHRESQIVASVPRTEMGGTINAFDIDGEGMIWLYTNPDSNIYKISPGGETTLVATNLPIDAPAIVIDKQGDIYFTSASGVFRIYQEP